ncbi:NAD(P)-dependent alcohol dehydrogenase [Alkalicoccobacillus murimartini]|uniref:NADPH:quinone reductase-like Zn-dependent oxidoreductase n=1 Tax=Alkalicoccobacillus murimartini TaxID=171685 RepID=A0ABT9YL91_9BACI|nr:NAD(P)-dependent alcohol dehydrogenase [Alkalicoccobacillus murimartini]MDQ0208639.1 NADPH:quinone reductase-like Zn-dependent oxidoreductase [Alkalicoccobacillus murimartini]
MTTSKNKMRAAQYNDYGSPDVLYEGYIAKPAVKPEEVLIRIYGTSVNPMDTMFRSGKLKMLTGKTFPKSTGVDFSGEIVEIGLGVTRFQVGDKVWGLLPMNLKSQMGTAAEYVSIVPEQLSLSPTNIDLLQAAALPGVGATAIIALRTKTELKRGERLLVRGASGGVGSLAVQIGRMLGAHVTALASAKHLHFLKDIGADEVFDYSKTSPADLGTFDVIMDTVGTDLKHYRRLLTNNGRMVTISFPSFATFSYIVGSSIFGSRRVRTFSANPKSELLKELAGYVDAGYIKPIIDSIYPLSDIAEAHRSLEAGGGCGKRIIQI